MSWTKTEKMPSSFNTTGFFRHTPYHYSTTLRGDRLDWWPTKSKWRWRDETYTGDVHQFIKEINNERR